MSTHTPGSMCTHTQTFCTRTLGLFFILESFFFFSSLYSFNTLPPFFSLSPASSLCHATHFYIVVLLSVCLQGLWPPYNYSHCAVCSFTETYNEKSYLFPFQKSWPLAWDTLISLRTTKPVPKVWATTRFPAHLHRQTSLRENYPTLWQLPKLVSPHPCLANSWETTQHSEWALGLSNTAWMNELGQIANLKLKERTNM